MRANCAAGIDTERAVSWRNDAAGDTASWPVPGSLHDGDMTVTPIAAAAGEQLDLPACAARVGLAVVTKGEVCFETGSTHVRASAGQGVLNAHLNPITGMCASGGEVIHVALPRNATQAWASEHHGGARRLARAAFIFQADADLAGLAGGGCGKVRTGAVVRAVIAALAAHDGIDVACPPSRSVSLARCRLDADPSRAWDLEDLARGVGVTPITLQRGFRECVGVTVAGYAQRIRLGDARTRLMSARETRPVSAIAHAAGFASVTAFARAYQRVFGETPTRTRADSARFRHGVHIELD